MRRILILMLASVILLSCASIRKTGCDTRWKQPKKPVYRGFMSLNATTIKLLDMRSKYAHVEAVTEDGRCMYIKYYGRRAELVSIGTIFTVYASKGDQPGTWLTTRIKLKR